MQSIPEGKTVGELKGMWLLTVRPTWWQDSSWTLLFSFFFEQNVKPFLIETAAPDTQLVKVHKRHV